jgi:pyruvate dehydrogenase E2 component (dihydrolipoamide acetyltransferase)
MPFIFKFPDIGEGISEGKILEWHVRPGQTVKSGEALVKVETDKVVTDIPSPKDGIITTCFGKPGDVVLVERPLVEMEISGAASSPPVSPEKKEQCLGVVGNLEVAADESCLQPSHETMAAPKEEKKALATPVARATARELKINIHEVPGTGPEGRVTKKDIESYAQRQIQPIPKPEVEKGKPELVEITEISQIRKAIAKKMVLSKQTAPHMTVMEEVEISSLVQLRESQKQKFAERGAKLTYLPFVIKAVTESLKKHKALNSQFDMEKGHILYKHYYNIGIAVDAPDGLVVPVIRNADRLSIYELATSISHLAQLAKERKLTLSGLKDGTFSITNFGALAGLYGVPIINYPEVAILGVGRVAQTPVVIENKVQIGECLEFSLYVELREVDGGEASRFLQDVLARLADPVSMLLG